MNQPDESSAMVRTWAVALWILAAAACAQTPVADLPSAVAAPIADLSSLCTEIGGIPHGERAVQAADLNGDGIDELILYVGWMVCENAWSLYGDREKLVSVFAVDHQGGAREVFAASVYDVRLDSGTDIPRLVVTLMSGGCGRPPAPTFAEETFCERDVVWDAGSGKFAFAPLATVRLIE